MDFLQKLFRGGPERERSGGGLILPHQPEWSKPQEFPDPIVTPSGTSGNTASFYRRHGISFVWGCL